MPLIKDGAFSSDPWVRVDDRQALPDGPVVITLRRWLAERGALEARNAPLGLVLASDEAPDALADDIARFDLICLEFPRFTDGRAYSCARKLRERLGYGGELRAVGNVLRDQFLFMHRCGFDAFEVSGNDDPASWQRAVTEISVAYQSAADRRATIVRQRHADEAPKRR
ncbi:MAG: DUF934 domain-containing protein [Rhodospirillales bacterium]|nr:DUF934 domain-containing protein [Rhodospirillales bacterium]